MFFTRPGASARLLPLLLASVVLAAACDDPSTPEPSPPLAIVLMIGDGMGYGSLTAARLAGGPLHMDQLPHVADVETGSASSDITDSGAAATALATGTLTANRRIAMSPDGEPLRTVLEAARDRGMATGLVATSTLTHATPAAFAAHVEDRGQGWEIARQMAYSDPDLLLGGGRRYFTSRADGEDLTERFAARGCAILLTLPPEAGAPCALGLFAHQDMPSVLEGRTPALADMTRYAIETLGQHPDGFFLMIEGSQIDWAGHDNDGPRNTAETLDFDQAVAAAMAALAGRPNTLFLVTADHETGGLDAVLDDGEIVYSWTGTGHTARRVPLFGHGPGLDALGDVTSLDAIGRLMLELVRREP